MSHKAFIIFGTKKAKKQIFLFKNKKIGSLSYRLLNNLRKKRKNLIDYLKAIYFCYKKNFLILNKNNSNNNEPINKIKSLN